MINGTPHTIGGEQNNEPRLRLFHSVVQPFQRSYIEHRHTAFELSLICSGSGIYRAGEKSYSFREGDIFLFSTNEAHCIVEVSGVLDILNLQFEPRFLWSAENALYQVQYPDIFFKRNDDYSHKLSIRADAAREIGRRLQSVEQEFIQKKTDYRLMVKLQILELLVLIRREYADWFRKSAGKVQVSYLSQMERALEYIDRNLTEEIHLEAVAREAAMSSAYFSTLFKKLNGMTLWEYVQSRRIELAAEKLLNTDKTVGEIAMECGYNSISNFNRSFKAVTGQTPVAYRKANREEQ